MPHSYNKIWIHGVWGTKFRQQLISPKIENYVYDYLRSELIKIGCPVRIINGMPDHVHCLFLLSPKLSIAKVLQQIKGSSSQKITEMGISKKEFAWQTGYGAFSVSESGVEKVYNYIKNQKQHHLKKSFKQEYEEFLKLYNVPIETEITHD